MRYPPGSGIAIGIFFGALAGIVTGNTVSSIFLGVMFGSIGELAMRQKEEKRKTDEKGP